MGADSGGRNYRVFSAAARSRGVRQRYRTPDEKGQIERERERAMGPLFAMGEKFETGKERGPGIQRGVIEPFLESHSKGTLIRFLR